MYLTGPDLDCERMKTVPPDHLLATTLRAIGDAVISCDRDGRVFMMNAVAEQLTGWSEQEALGRPLTDVFVIVREGTREPVEDPVVRVLRLGRAAGLASETLLLRRDGTELPIDDSAAPVRDVEGDIRGVVLVFREVTERRRAEWNLQMLAESGRVLAEARDVRSILQQISEAVNRHFADVCVFDLVAEGDVVEREVGRHRNPARQEEVDRLMQFRPRLKEVGLATREEGDVAPANAEGGDAPLRARAALPSLEVMAKGRPVLVAKVSNEYLESVARSEEQLRFLRDELRPRSLLSVPLITDEHLLGVMTFVRHVTLDPFTQGDVVVAEEMGQRIGLAMQYAQMREALQLERARLEAVVAAVPVGILMAQTDGRIVLANREVERLFRQPVRYSENTEAHADYVAFHRDGTRVRGEEFPLPRAMAEDQVFRDERYQFLRGDGSRAWVSLSAAPVKQEDGTVVGGVVAMADVDLLVRAQEGTQAAMSRMERSERRLTTLMERASVGIAVSDPRGGLKFANDVLLTWIGYTRAEMVAGTIRWDRLTPEEYSDRDHKAFRQLHEVGFADPYEKAYLAKDGTRVPMLVGAVLIPSTSGRATEKDIALFYTDLRPQKRAEAALLQTEKLTAVGRLASSISHEINNPLEAVTNLLYLLKNDTSLSQHGRDYVDMADRELARVSQVVSQTLRFHRQTTSATCIQPEALIEEVLQLYRTRLTSSEVVISREYDPGVTLTCFDGDIRQVLSNLIGNAFDAMRRGGRLRLRARRAHWWPTGQMGVMLTVADTGSGMPAEVHSKIFDAFFSTKGIHGTGLGLWISMRIVHKHRGQLLVRSRTGAQHGTVFQLWLPAALAATASESWHADALTN